jgi:hypothetical protein
MSLFLTAGYVAVEKTGVLISHYLCAENFVLKIP